ncbi:Mov34/MPN/PAD-1 family protein [Allomesorhizobium camelthorni]|uniref:JAB domain-containing protein n=1 Tax=Allomesorhizobium camelthorni TaxID=475069 RepID=A0A6G4WHM8_9HYPH|nr:hypothetical protein [Mesorhizobium camelthorni]
MALHSFTPASLSSVCSRRTPNQPKHRTNRRPDHHASALESFFQRTGSDFRGFNYLGEWHSHPSFPVRPSREDMMSMQSLVNGERDIDFSALVIVRLRCFLLLDTAAYMFVRHSTPSQVALTT